MSICEKMTSVLNDLTVKYLMNTGDEDDRTAVILKAESLLDFTVEFQGDVVCAGYYFVSNGDQVPDPMLWFRRTERGLVLTLLEQRFGHTKVDDTNAAELHDFAEQYAELIRGRYIERTADHVEFLN